MLRGEVLGGDTERVLRAAADATPASLTRGIGRLVLRLLRKVKQEKLSGQVLNVRTGRLRRSINQRIEGANTARVSGVVGTNVDYGRKHEFGFTGQETVKQHLRNQVKAWGRDIEPMQVTVSSHTRNVKLPERSFLRSALAEMQPDIEREGLAIASEVIKK